MVGIGAIVRSKKRELYDLFYSLSIQVHRGKGREEEDLSTV
jgi:hypothetical protein